MMEFVLVFVTLQALGIIYDFFGADKNEKH